MVFASFLYFAFGDSAAALVGKIIGRHKTFPGKSLEGSLACFAVCFIAGLFIFNWQFALAGATIAAIVEAIPWKISDNFWMQIINAGVLTLLSYMTSPMNYIR
jgi:dolichol kinase